MLKTYARIQDNLVAELFKTAHDVRALFNPALIWVDVTNMDGLREGWAFDGTTFQPPPPVDAPAAPSLIALEAQLRALSTLIASLQAG